jgi:hypothetical protein
MYSVGLDVETLRCVVKNFPRLAQKPLNTLTLSEINALMMIVSVSYRIF